jgi:transcription elongation GreA/GreB family factor
MRTTRLLTLEEAAVIEEAAEKWLRMRDVEFNAGEWAADLLAEAELRSPDCRRRDIASLGRSILLEIAGELEPECITLVRPGEEDPRAGRVSILGDIGLACIGQVVCSEIRLPHGTATFIGFADTRPFESGFNGAALLQAAAAAPQASGRFPTVSPGRLAQ